MTEGFNRHTVFPAAPCPYFIETSKSSIASVTPRSPHGSKDLQMRLGNSPKSWSHGCAVLLADSQAASWIAQVKWLYKKRSFGTQIMTDCASSNHTDKDSRRVRDITDQLYY